MYSLAATQAFAAIGVTTAAVVARFAAVAHLHLISHSILFIVLLQYCDE
jgi:hypothetical protein